MQGEQPEEPGGRGRDGGQGPGEDRGDVRRGVGAGEGLQTAVRRVQFGGDRRQREVGVGGRAGGDAGQGERQSGAQSGDLGHGPGLGVDARDAQPPGEEGAGLVGVEGTQGQSRAPCAATSPDGWLRLVTMVRHPGVPGSSGFTWSVSRALSSRTRKRRPANRLR